MAGRVRQNASLARRWLILGDWRAYPARVALAVLAIAVGIALGFAVHLINGSALVAFGQAIRTVSGAADLQIRATNRLGIDEGLYPIVARVPGIADASPVVELAATMADRKEAFTLLGLDVLRAVNVTPGLVGQRPSGPDASGDTLFDPDSLFLSRAALVAGRVPIGSVMTVIANGRAVQLRVAGVLPGVEEGRRVGVMDIAALQWRFQRLGRLDRVDLKFTDANDADAVRERLAALLPRDALLASGATEIEQAGALSRAYRINLEMLALVALLTGAFLVYSAQSLSVTRRMRSFALLRTLGLPQSGIVRQLAIEGAVVGVIGAAAGLILGYALADAALRLFGGDLGAGYFGGVTPRLIFAPHAAALFFALGVGAALAGSILPGRAAARTAPAVALRNAGEAIDPRAPAPWRMSLLLMVAAVAAALLPAILGLPLFGYAAIAMLLAGGTAAMPWLARTLLAPFDRAAIRIPAVELAIRHLRGAPGQAIIALSGIVASVGLMIAMAVMVTSFRGSVDDWLQDVLSADLYLRIEGGGGFDPAVQQQLRQTPGVATIDFSRQQPLLLSADRPPVTLIVRTVDKARASASLHLISAAAALPSGAVPVWLSEPAARSLHLGVGDMIALPLGRDERFVVGGIWRDYARQQGAITIHSEDYDRLTGDRSRDQAAVISASHADPATVGRALVSSAPPELAGKLTLARPSVLRRSALSLFDRSFAITYLLEAVAILVGLAGVGATISAQTVARSREFGMLRHIGASKKQIIAMLASEGALLGMIGGIAGVLLGLAMSQVLIHVINPQSFNWTMTTRLPAGLIGMVAAALVIAAAGTAALAGRRALSVEAVRAVREDW